MQEIGLASAVLGAALGAALARWLVARRLHEAAARVRARLTAAAHEAEGHLAAAEASAAREKIEAQARAGREREAATSQVAALAAELDERERLLLERRHDLDAGVARSLLRRSELDGRHHDVGGVRQEAGRLAESLAEHLEARAGTSRIELVEQSVRERLSRAELSAQRQLRSAEEEARQSAPAAARRLMSIACSRYDGVGHLDRLQNLVPVADRAMIDLFADAESPAARAFFAAVGCEVIADAPALTLSVRGDDPLAREIARRVLRQLANKNSAAADLIHSIAVRVRAEVEAEVQNAGKKALRTLEIGTLHPELLQLVGRLKFRLSYSQNQWKHALEVGWLAGIMAHELGLDVQLAKRAGLLHDIGKAMTHDHDGSHAVLGAEVARRCGEAEVIANAIGSHHNDEAAATPLAHLVTAADAMSGGRPGARRENVQSYIARIRDIQEIAGRSPVVERVDIMHAGREVRVVVASDERGETEAAPPPQALGDADLHPLAQSIARQLEEEIAFAGQIRVTVIRESRSVSIAR